MIKSNKTKFKRFKGSEGLAWYEMGAFEHERDGYDMYGMGFETNTDRYAERKAWF